MANSDASSSTTITVRVLVSFYLVATIDSSSAKTAPIHEENFKVPLRSDEHKRLPESKQQAVVSRRFHSELKMPGNMSLTLLSGETGCSKVLETM